jgi:hypothetical protein
MQPIEIIVDILQRQSHDYELFQYVTDIHSIALLFSPQGFLGRPIPARTHPLPKRPIVYSGNPGVSN